VDGTALGARRRVESSDTATEAVLVASRALVGVAARSLAATEGTITLVQYRALVLLASRGDLNIGSLADALGVHQSTATRLCDRLVTKGLIGRATSAESRREVLVTLTPSGQALIGTVTTRRRDEIARIMARLTPAQRTRLADAFRVFADAAAELPDDAWKFGWNG
jgi:DNA-binding MarR family transcriptional regulator